MHFSRSADVLSYATNKGACRWQAHLGGKTLTVMTMKLSYRINKNIDLIFDYLSDMQKFVSVHPVIFRIDATRNESYLVHVRIKFGFIPFSFSHPIKIEKSIVEKKIIIHTTILKMIEI